MLNPKRTQIDKHEMTWNFMETIAYHATNSCYQKLSDNFRIRFSIKELDEIYAFFVM